MKNETVYWIAADGTARRGLVQWEGEDAVMVASDTFDMDPKHSFPISKDRLLSAEQIDLLYAAVTQDRKLNHWVELIRPHLDAMGGGRFTNNKINEIFVKVQAQIDPAQMGEFIAFLRKECEEHNAGFERG